MLIGCADINAKDDAGSIDDTEVLRALQELVAYAFEESAPPRR